MSKSVPEGWRKSSIGQITSTGSLFSDGDWVESKDQDPSGANRLIQLADIGDGKFVNKSSRFMNDEQFHRLKCTELRKNDILIARMPDPLGRACLYPLDKGRAATVVDVAILRTENADHYWLMSAINSSDFRYQIDLNASGTTRTRISRGILSEIQLLEPPLPEQQKIAAILSSVDDVIEKTRAQIDKLKDLKTGMMQELLTKGIGHTEFKDSPVGRVPAIWSVLRLEEVVENIIDCEHKTAPYVDHSEFLVVRTSNVREGELVLDDMRFTTEEAFGEWTKRATPSAGDVLFTREAPAGESCMVPAGLNICMGQRMVLLRPKADKVYPEFFSLYLTSNAARLSIYELSIGTTVTRINIEDIKRIPCVVPPIEEQREIYKQIDSIQSLVTRKTAQLNANQHLKKALMQDLLTGKVRVKPDSNKPEAVSTQATEAVKEQLFDHAE